MQKKGFPKKDWVYSALAMTLVWISLLAGSFLRGQSSWGTILGRASDASNAVVPNAHVELVNEDTQVRSRTTTNQEGDYVFSNVIPGNYQITISAKGFRTYVVNHIVLYVNNTVRQNAKLEVGSSVAKVEVKASLPLVQTDTTSVGSVIDSKQIESMPLNGRNNPFGMLAIAPGVQNPGANARIGGDSWAGGANETMDGVPSMEMENERLADATPSLDSIGEFKVITSTGSADSGPGTIQVIVSTKSGTNQFHGSAFEYNRVAALEAANFFATGLPKAPFVRNEFGGSLGGPIKRDKMFFFGSFEGFTYRSSNTVELAQPTAALLNGDFTGLPPVIDPLTGQQFPNNQIPADRINSTAKALFPFWETPNLSTSAPGGLGTNYVNTPGLSQDNLRWEGRWDYAMRPQDSLSTRFYFVRQNPNQPYAWGTSKYGGILWPDDNINLAVNYTHIITPTLFNLATFGYSRESDNLYPLSHNFDPTSIIPSLPPGYPGLNGVPTININGFSGPNDWSGSGDVIPSYQFSDALTWVKGTHTVKAGFSVLNFQFYNYQNPGPAHGTFTFTGQYTGNAFADYLLGDLAGSAYPLAPIAAKPENNRFGMYVQDDWKATPKLTVNWGLRYDLPTQYQNVTGNMANWYPNLNQVVALKGQYDATLFPGLPIISGQSIGLGPGNYTNNPHNLWAPRLGLAYRPLNSSRVVLRGGYGLYYNVWPWNYGSFSLANNPPYAASVYFEPAPGNTPSLFFSNPFPTGTGSVPSGLGLTALAKNYDYPLSQEWNLTVESQISANTSLRATYLGVESQHLPESFNINDPIPAPGPVQPRRPYQPFGPITYTENGVTANTQELQLSALRRFSSGMSFEVEYAWTKALGLGDPGPGTPTDNQNLRYDRGNDPLIRQQYVVANYVYDLPFGKGRRYLTDLSGPLNALLGGWETSGIVTIGSGLPFSVTFDSTVEGWPSNRANIVGSPHVSNPTLAQWFNPAAFAIPQPFTWGDSAPNSLFGPGYSEWDAAVFKQFRLSERFSLQFRTEMFNALNHPSFSNPVSDLSSPSVGQVTSTSTQSRSIQFALRLEF